MSASKLFLFQIFAVLTFMYICSCNYTHTYAPEFNTKPTKILDSINKKYAFENIQIQGKTTTGISGMNNVLIIRLVNGGNLPTDTEKMDIFAQQLAHKIKSIVKNPETIESFKVYFYTKTVNGDTTTTRSMEVEFKADNI
jgi:hypothetical protein